MTIPPIAAEPIFSIGSFPVTNSMISAWVAAALFVVFAWFVRRRVSVEKPGRFQLAVEGLLEFMLGYADQVTGDRARSKRFLPIVGTLFLFILACNWLGILPGVGTIWRTIELHGHVENAPIFRPANADLNLTLAMALVSVVASHLLGIVTIGFFAHWNKFIAIGTLFRSFRKKPIDIVVAIVEMLVGVIEFVAEIAKVVSLSLRLFGNIFAGEVLITVMYSLVAFVVPLPFTALELIVGLVQATVFAMLSLVYLTILTEKPHGHDEAHDRKAHLEDEYGAAQEAHAKA